ncbi:hypothetical protein CWB79_01055 [Pseudoalteromonas sp. S1649]|nr:hypothetical protein CWB80_07805 [Pseudoalteromonas sp. S1650]TMP70046.1 hypothetical protein CWB79_01055 [Pseudoalteromonas sp. S1649]
MGKKYLNFTDPYESKFPDVVKVIKIYLQFFIGFILITILTIKGLCEAFETLGLLSTFEDNSIVNKVLGIDTFSYIANALAISAGIELGHMLFTNGPDEAIEPLMLGVTSAAFYTLSANSGGSWVLGIYALSILVLMFCLKKYKDWKLDHTDEEPPSTDNSEKYSVKVAEGSIGSFTVDVKNIDNKPIK